MQSITEYDMENRPSKHIIDTTSKILETKYNYYDELGNITHKVSITKDGVIKEALHYCYDGMNRLKSDKRYKQGNLFDYYNEYSYDDNGNIITKESFDEAGLLIAKVQYTYDSIIKDQLKSISETIYQNGVIIATNTKQFNYLDSYRFNPTSYVDNGLSYGLVWEGRRL